MKPWKNRLLRLRDLLRDEEGPTSVEYAVILSMIIAVCFGGIAIFGGSVRQTFMNSVRALVGL